MAKAGQSNINEEIIELFNEKIKKRVDQLLLDPKIALAELKKIEVILKKFTKDVTLLKVKIMRESDQAEIKKILESIKAIK
jgi:hypothetical protein